MGEVEVDEEAVVAVEERAGLGRAVGLFASGLVGGVLVLVGLSGVASSTLSHGCCGASAEERLARDEVRRRCMELGVTPDELAAMDLAAIDRPAAIAGEE
ncbi:MAG: hypothetical protein M9894_08685 [Planctomycetes bacterium]|nr:hypothetical protein [Planctomycetota bacterium]